MNRTEKIVRLVAVGFSATHLGRSSNEELDATYIAATPLMVAQDEEVDRVLSREKSHSKSMRAEIAHRHRDRNIEETWSRNWKPLAPICTVAADVNGYLESIRGYSGVYEEQKALFRKTGFKRHADAANTALQRMRHLQSQLVHLSESVSP